MFDLIKYFFQRDIGFMYRYPGILRIDSTCDCAEHTKENKNIVTLIVFNNCLIDEFLGTQKSVQRVFFISLLYKFD